LEVCTLLIHAGTKEELTLKDSGGLTPVQLAAEKGHRHLSNILVGPPYHFYLPVKHQGVCFGK
jgi:hypothetical protein